MMHEAALARREEVSNLTFNVNVQSEILSA